jgi:hypothetical protein
VLDELVTHLFGAHFFILSAGFIAPVYTKAARKLKMHEIPVIQRKLVYSANQPAGASCVSGSCFLRRGTFLEQLVSVEAYSASVGFMQILSDQLLFCVHCHFVSAGDQPQDGGGATTASLFIEIIDSPSFIQAESYRSCAHLAGHVHEQMLRYVDVGE